MSNLPTEIWNTLTKLSALEERTKDIRNSQERIENKLDSIIERISRLEEKYENLRENLKHEILGDIKAEIAKTQAMLNFKEDNKLPGNKY